MVSLFFPQPSLHLNGSPLRVFGVATLVCGLVLTGCSGTDGPVQREVSGKVTFQGSPVEEGMITFEDAQKGYAESSELGPGGAYKLNAPDGNYTVYVEPPMTVIEDTADTPGGEEEKQVDNIPVQYRNSVESPLKAVVAGDGTVQDFDLQP